MGWMTALLAVGATARITRLIGRDTITFFFRDWLAAMTEDNLSTPAKGVRARFFSFVEDMVACPWCLSIWVSVPIAVLAWLYGDTLWFIVPALALTASHLTGMTAAQEA